MTAMSTVSVQPSVDSAVFGFDIIEELLVEINRFCREETSELTEWSVVG